MDDASLIAGVEDGSWPEACFSHREHVRLAWALLRDGPFESGAARFCAALRGYAAAKGRASRYHETITWAYLAIVNERIRSGPQHRDFESFAAANPDLLEPGGGGALAAHYDAATLASARARAAFVLPRRA